MKAKLYNSMCSINNLFLLTFLALSSLFSISFLVGASVSSISGFALLAPVLASMGSIQIPFLMVISKLFFKHISSAGISFLPITLYIPTVCSMLYGYYSYTWLRISISMICITLFLMHPVGYGAAPYALFWLIPIICSFVSKKHIFWTMLGATFTAHAVGSVLWLYQVPMTSAQFLALIPIVIVERCMMACIMTVAYYLLKNVHIQRYLLPLLSLKMDLKHS